MLLWFAIFLMSWFYWMDTSDRMKIEIEKKRKKNSNIKMLTLSYKTKVIIEIDCWPEIDWWPERQKHGKLLNNTN